MKESKGEFPLYLRNEKSRPVRRLEMFKEQRISPAYFTNTIFLHLSVYGGTSYPLEKSSCRQASLEQSGISRGVDPAALTNRHRRHCRAHQTLIRHEPTVPFVRRDKNAP